MIGFREIWVGGVAPGADGFRYYILTSLGEESIGYLTKVFPADSDNLPDMESGPLMVSKPKYTAISALENHADFCHRCCKGLFNGPKN